MDCVTWKNTLILWIEECSGLSNTQDHPIPPELSIHAELCPHCSRLLKATRLLLEPLQDRDLWQDPLFRHTTTILQWRYTMSHDQSPCMYHLACHFYNIGEMTPSSQVLKERYCMQRPDKCRICQRKSLGKPVPITLWPNGNILNNSS